MLPLLGDDCRLVDELAEAADEAHSAGILGRSASSTLALTRHFASWRIWRRWRGGPPPVTNACRPFANTFLSPWPTTSPQKHRAASFDGPNLKRRANGFYPGRDVTKLLTTGVHSLMDAKR